MAGESGKLTRAAGGGGPDRVQVDTSAAAIDLNFAGRTQRIFVGAPDIAAPKTWQLSNATVGMLFNFEFTLAGLHAQSMPANFRMSDALWDSVTNVWTPLDVGLYQAYGVFDGTNWNLTIVGPFT